MKTAIFGFINGIESIVGKTANHTLLIFLKNISYKAANLVKLLYLIINKLNGYIEGSNEKKYLSLFATDESKDKLVWKRSMKQNQGSY